MENLTILYLTASQIPESFATYQRKVLLEAIGSTPLISISRKPLDFGINLLDEEEKTVANIYRQMLRGAKLATTDYIGIAEDDCLYHKEHFTLRPPLDTFLYNQSRWALFSWDKSAYSWRNRKSNCSLISPRLLMIEALEERFLKYPDNTMPPEWTGELGREKVDKWLGVTPRKSIEVFSKIPIIQINHEYGTEDIQKRQRKSFGNLIAQEVLYWGQSKLIKI